MFRKSFAVKSNVQLKSSDKKKLREQIGRMWVGVTTDEISALVPIKSDLSAVKCTSWKGLSVTIYCREKQPIAFECDELIFPTVYTLWQLPTAVPRLVTHSPVMEHLQRGADLMSPGIVLRNPGDLGSFLAESVSAVVLLGNGAAVAVGKMLASSQQLIDSGLKGPAVKIYHVYNDSLWEFGTRQLLPSLPCCLTTANPVDTQGLEEVHSFDETEQLLTTLESTQISTDDSTMDPDKDSVAQSVLVPPTEPLEESPTDEELVLGLRRCFLQALKYRVTKSDPLPILSNVFYANNLLPVISANLKSAGPFNIKKTPYKKVGTFLEAMQSAGYIELKEASKGVQSVVAINWSHSDLESLRRADYMEEISEEQENHSQYKLPEIAELFSVTSPVATVLCVADPNIRKGMELSAKQVREMLVSYVRGGQLQVGRNVTLDPHLSDLVQAVNKTKSPPAQMSIDDLVATVLQGMTECYSITYSSGKVVKKKAKLPHINISVAQRAANKRVTLVSNLKLFDIDPTQFASQVQLGVACSASVHEDHLEGTLTQKVQIQGNQVSFIASLLQDQYGIPKKFIDGLELATKKKK